MRRNEHTSKLAGSVKEHSRRKGTDANRYKYELHHDPLQRKVSFVQAEPLVSKGSRNFNGVSSGVSHLGKMGLRENSRLKVVKTTAAVASPLAAGTIVGAVAVGFYGVANMLRYKRNEKSGVRATKDTITGSAGVGISTGLGVAAANVAVGAFGSMVLVPVAAGAAVAYVSMAVWDKLFYTGKCSSKTS